MINPTNIPIRQERLRSLSTSSCESLASTATGNTVIISSNALKDRAASTGHMRNRKSAASYIAEREIRATEIRARSIQTPHGLQERLTEAVPTQTPRESQASQAEINHFTGAPEGEQNASSLSSIPSSLLQTETSDRPEEGLSVLSSATKEELLELAAKPVVSVEKELKAELFEKVSEVSEQWSNLQHKADTIFLDRIKSELDKEILRTKKLEIRQTDLEKPLEDVIISSDLDRIKSELDKEILRTKKLEIRRTDLEKKLEDARAWYDSNIKKLPFLDIPSEVPQEEKDELVLMLREILDSPFFDKSEAEKAKEASSPFAELRFDQEVPSRRPEGVVQKINDWLQFDRACVQFDLDCDKLQQQLRDVSELYKAKAFLADKSKRDLNVLKERTSDLDDLSHLGDDHLRTLPTSSRTLPETKGRDETRTTVPQSKGKRGKFLGRLRSLVSCFGTPTKKDKLKPSAGSNPSVGRHSQNASNTGVHQVDEHSSVSSSEYSLRFLPLTARMAGVHQLDVHSSVSSLDSEDSMNPSEYSLRFLPLHARIAGVHQLDVQSSVSSLDSEDSMNPSEYSLRFLPLNARIADVHQVDVQSSVSSFDSSEASMNEFLSKHGSSTSLNDSATRSESSSSTSLNDSATRLDHVFSNIFRRQPSSAGSQKRLSSAGSSPQISSAGSQTQLKKSW